MQHDFVRGAGLMLVATILFSISDTMAKSLSHSVPAAELLFIRYCVFIVLAALPFLRRSRPPLRSRRPVLQVVRGVGIAGSAICFVLSLGNLPIAEATAINFVTPIMIAALAVPLLGETVGAKGWAAMAAGFAGVVVIVRPGPGSLQPAALLVLLSSLSWCVAMLVTRRMGGTERSDTTLLWTAATGLAMLAAVQPFFARPIPLTSLALCLALGLVASAGQWCALMAYRLARASAVAPLAYFQLIWSSALGALVFDAIPDRFTIVGAAIIAGSGLVLIHLQRTNPRAEADVKARRANR